MKTLEYTTVDKTEWPAGEWHDEPDKIQYIDESTGFPCIVKRGPMGGLCGYVGISKGHPLFEVHYGDDAWPDYEPRVHGGVTYTSKCQEHDPGDEGHAICHVVEDDEDDDVWWIGFDCGHSWDLQPGLLARYPQFARVDEEYRNIEYVKRECAGLAEQLKGMK